nr:cation:dicarboxylase symporter family transporter [Acidobacteriota bacterium]
MAGENKAVEAARRRPWWRLSLTGWILVGLVAGAALGYFRPAWGVELFFLRNIFLNLIKSVIAPLVFSTLVVGIAGGGDLKKVGRMGVKALVYFEVVTTVALFIGLAVVNLTKPGVGVTLAETGGAAVQQIQQTQPQTFTETLTHIFPA